MTTFLLSYNPRHWQWNQLTDVKRHLEANGSVESRWSCSNTTQITAGARLFIIRLGVPPKGIFASGYAISDWYPDVHWDSARAAQGDTTHYVRTRLDKLFDPDNEPILTLDQLKQPPFSHTHWEIRASGVRIPSSIADDLEERWEQFTV